MTQDLISDNFADSVNRTLIKKTLGVNKNILNLIIIYNILVILDWYIAISRSVNYHLDKPAVFFQYRVHPVIALVLIAINIVSTAYFVRASKLIDESFEASDATLFNIGYGLYLRSSRLGLLSICISIFTIGIRLLLK